MQKIFDQFLRLFIRVDRFVIGYLMFEVGFTLELTAEVVLLGSTDDFPSTILMTFPYVVGLTKIGLGYSY
jgi:hypothetical protein